MSLALLPRPLLPSTAMLVVHVRRDGQELRSHHFEQSEITIGRVHGQDIELPASQVSRRHARIAWRGDRVSVTDNGSTHGTKVNGGRIKGVMEGRFSEMLVDICGYQLTFEITEGTTDRSPRSLNVPTLIPSEITAPDGKHYASGHPGPPSRPSLRKLLDRVLPSDDDFEAFCLDYFPEVHKGLAAGMSRLGKQTALLQKASCEDVMQALCRHSHEKVQQHQHVLEFEASRT